MSIEDAILARAYPRALAARAQETLLLEASKGCRREIALNPVPLEPPFQPIYSCIPESERGGWRGQNPETNNVRDGFSRYQIWISPEQRCEWNRSELFLKNLYSLQHRVAFEILGNERRIVLQVLCHVEDLPVLRTAFVGQFELCTLSPVGDANDVLRSMSPRTWAEAEFFDFYPLPPYSHLMTVPDELKRSPYTTLFASLAELPSTALGLYQVVFQPVSPLHDWRRNVQTLLDVEHKVSLLNGLNTAPRYPMQTPSHDLHHMARDAEVRAHRYKHFFAAAVRVAVMKGHRQSEAMLRTLAVVVNVILHDGRPLCFLTADKYRCCLSPQGIRDVFAGGLTHRAGFLVNTEELTSLVHIPPPKETEHHHEIMNMLETLPASEELSVGTPIGLGRIQERTVEVCIEPALRTTHTHVIGGIGTGKSTLLEHMVLDDIARGHGVAVLDPHGRLIHRLLRLIPEDMVERVIHFEPGDPASVPLWNPLYPIPGRDTGEMADDLVLAFKKIVKHWGDRLENLLRQAFFAALSMPGSTLLDVYDLMRNKTKQTQLMRDRILDVVDNEVARGFWLHDFATYGKDDLGPPKNKLSKLLLAGSVSLMLSQPESRLVFPDMMKSGKIFLADLSTVGFQVREILGCYLLELMRIASGERDSANPKSLLPYHIYCDEAQKFLTDAMENLIEEARKYRVSLTLAHHYMSQFNTRKGDALSGVGSTIIFRVDRNDAQHLTKDLFGEVDPDDLKRLETGQAVARIGNRVVRLKTRRPLSVPKIHFAEAIVARSRAKYYAPADEVKRALHERRQNASSSDSTQTHGGGASGGRSGDVGPGCKSERKDNEPPASTFDYERF